MVLVADPDIDCTPGGSAQVAACAYTTVTGKQRVTRQLIVRRTRLVHTAQQRLWPDWRRHTFTTAPDTLWLLRRAPT